ncbi:Uncharacterised protein [Bordetella pertussis]|nr:Uncharacterised protein [Bordetella pertussis]
MQLGLDPRVGAAEDDPHAAALQVGDDLFERLQAGDVDERHPAQADDERARIGVRGRQGALEVLGGAEEQRPFDRVDQHVVRQRPVAAVAQFVAQLGRALRLHLHAGRHAPQEVQDGDHHADVDRHHQVGEHGQHEGDQQDGDVGARRALDHPDEVRRVAHVPGHHEQDGGQRGQRHVFGQRRQQQHHQQQGDAMHDPGQRAGAAVADVGGRARDGAGGGKAAEQRRDDIGQALADQFLVGIVAGAGHAVGHHGRQQGFDGAQHGDGESRADQFDDARHGDLGPLPAGQALRNAAESAAYGGYAVQAQRGLQRGGHHERHQRTGHAAQVGQAVVQQQQRQRQRGQCGGGQVQLRQAVHELPQFFMEVRAGRGGQAEEILPLAYPDDDADPGGEAHDDRRWDVLDDGPQPGRAQRQQDAAGHQGGQLQARHAMLGGDAGQDDDEGAGGAGNLYAAAAAQRDQQARHDGGVQALFGFGAAGDGKGHGQRQRHDPYDQAGDNIGQPMGASQQAGALGFEQGDHTKVQAGNRMRHSSPSRTLGP